MSTKVQLHVGEKELSIETGKLAKQANGAVTVRYGDTVVLVTVVSPTERTDRDFLPLTVDYREKTSAAGRFPGGYIKRETRPTEKEILTMRQTDRPLRPLFPSGYRSEVQIIGSVLSADGQNDPDVLLIVGASAALTISDIPFSGPIAGVRVGLLGDRFVINPTSAQMAESSLNLVVAGTEKAVTMVEGGASEVSEDILLDGITFGHEAIKEIVAVQKELREKAGVTKREEPPFSMGDDVMTAVRDRAAGKLKEALKIPGKQERYRALKEISEAVKGELGEEFAEREPEIQEAVSRLKRDLTRKMILDDGVRSDGRRTDEIRPISCEVGFLPRTHGSALFTRGETQALVIITLGAVGDKQRIDTLAGEFSKSFMLHYTFPPFSVGEVKPNRGPSRREVGHGHLAERSLFGVVPDEFPYTIRVVSDILESNGSSSMASVCAGSLALMDAGVPIRSAVSGIAMGLVQEGERVAILSDILGSEDAVGDMDFKVAGTREGITAFQLDLKVEGLGRETMRNALEQARAGRLHILERMDETIRVARDSISQYAPKIRRINVPPDKLGIIIGPRGKMIKKIQAETGSDIEIEDSGEVCVSCSDEAMLDAAIDMILALTEDVEIGRIYKGIVKNILKFGAFVEILPGKEGLVHISKLAARRVEKVEDVLSVGDEVMVKVMEIDNKGRINLSRKDALKEPATP